MTERAEEYQFFKKIGICTSCHKRSAEPNKVLCLECADKSKEYDRNKRERHKEEYKKKDKEKYERLKEQGICTYCKHEKAMDGKTKCKKCLAKIRYKRNLKKNDIDRSERVSFGLCYICGKDELFEDKRVCKRCYDKRIESISKIMYMPVSEEWKRDNNLVYK